ncbi:MAG: hypothetical protein HYR50_09350 [Candidatus Rokubacteria bacterium]|nr:hypothetical protein [Candidatus Rokubacteria bacterium]
MRLRRSLLSARRLVAAFEAAVAEGRGLFVFDGRAIDLPVVEAERSILARARAAAGPAREAQEQPGTG